jgi:zinc protease
MEEFMIRGTSLLLLVLAGALALTAQTDDGKVFPYPINQVTLDNGLKIVSVPFDSPGIIAYYTVVRTGSRNEVEPGKSGFAHFFEHMMFRGTDKYSKEKFNDLLQSIGADNNANTSDDRTVYHTLASAGALETIMDMESDRFMNLKYSEPDFRTEAGAILGEYNKNYSSPFMTIFEKMREAAYDQHTYKHTTMGFLKDIEDMPNQYQYSLEFFDRWYRPENCVVVVVGDFNQEKLVALAKKYYGPWKRGTYKLDVPAEPPQTQEKVINLPWKAKTLPVVAMGYHGPAFSDDSREMPAMDLLSQLLFSPTSDLFRKLVVEQQLVEFVQGSQGDSRDPGLFQVFTRVKDPKNIELVRAEIEKAIEDAKVTPIPEERLKAIKSYLKYQYVMGLDNPNSVANSVGHYIMLTGDPESVNRVYRLYDQITPEDIMGVAKKYMTNTNRTTVILKQEESSQ